MNINNQELNLQVEIAEYMNELYNDCNFKYHHYVLYGGRGAGKSTQFIYYMIVQSFNFEYTGSVFLCVREIQKSIDKSVYPSIVKIIKALSVEHFFTIKKDEIINNLTSVRFQFAGLFANVDSIKSIPNIRLTFIEEAASISAYSYDILIPTVLREKRSRILVAFNPDRYDDIVYQEYVLNSKSNTYVKKVTYRDNPWKMGEAIYQEIQELKSKDIAKYNHIYEGELSQTAEELVFKQNRDYVISDVSDSLDYQLPSVYGLDFGFIDPTAAVRALYDSNLKIIYVTHEMYKTELGTNDILKELEYAMPDFKRSIHHIIADSARPETINLMHKSGCYISGCVKGKGSIEDGIAFLKSNQIIVNNRCKNLIDELSKYSFKKEKRSGIVTDVIEDSNNHLIDALRYAFNKYITNEALNYASWKF